MPAIASLTRSVGLRDRNHSRDDRAHDHGGDRHYPLSVRALLGQAQQGLIDAEYATHPVERFSRAYLAALRAAAAVLALRARPNRRARPTSAWTLLAGVAPEFAEWSVFFATASATRSAAEAGARHLVTERAADDMLRQVGQFLGLARHHLIRACQ